MLRSAKDLRGYTIQATDGEVGKTDDFFFDDQTWTIRYLVVETGNWLMGRRVLISPVSLGIPTWEVQTLPVTLTKAQVESSPHVDTDKPVSRQMEEELHRHYGYSPYWTSTRPMAAARVIERATSSTFEGQRDDLNLRSIKEVVGYDIQAADGKIGHVEDFVVDDESWTIRYMVVDTRDWLSGKKALVSPSSIHTVMWPERDVHIGLSRATVKDSPEFDPSDPVNAEYELRLYDFYGRPKDWTRVERAR